MPHPLMTRARGAGRSGLLLVAMTGTSLHAQGKAMTVDAGLDHIILGVSDLTRGIATFTRMTGVVPKRGGRHPGRGTENALVSLGAGQYLEILAPVAEAAGTSAAPGADTVSLHPEGWAVHTHALDQLISQVKAAGFAVEGPNPGSRRTPENILLEWRTASTSGEKLGLAPFFIEWGPGTEHPSSTSPAGCRLVSWTLRQPDVARLRAFLTAVGYAPILRTGPSTGMELVLDCPNGRVSFSS